MTAERQAQQAARPGVAAMPQAAPPMADEMGVSPAVLAQRGAMENAGRAINTGTNQQFLDSMKVDVPTFTPRVTREEPRPVPGPVREVQQNPAAPPPAAQPKPAAPWNPRTITSRGGHKMEGTIFAYDNNAGAILIQRRDGTTIAVPHEEVDDETHTAAFSAPRYAADERDRNQITSKRATLKQQREAAAQPKPQAPRPQAAQPKPFFPPPKTAPTFDNNAPDQAHGGTLPPQLPKPQEPAPRPAAVQAPTPVRLTDNTGKHSFEGNVVGHDHENNVVTIVGADGRPRHVHTSRLGEGTMNYVRGLNLPHSPAPADRAKALQPQLRPGDQRFRLTDGQQVDGQITGHDPSTRTVNVRRPDGRVVSIDVDSLDEASRSHYDSRVNEHAERVQFDNEKKAYEKEHGPGSHRFRQGAVVHTGNGRSVLIPPGAKFGADAATPEQGPVADAPPAARKVAEGVVATPPGQQAEGGRPGLPKREPGAAVDDQEQFDRNAAMSRADTQSRLRSGQGFANVEQQGPLVDNGLTDEIMSRRGEADAKDRAQMRDTAEAQTATDRQRAATQRARDEADPVAAANRKGWMEAVRNYRAEGGKAGTGVSLEEYAMNRGVDFLQVPEDKRIAARKSAGRMVAADERTRNAKNEYRWKRMDQASRESAAHRVMNDPNSTPQQQADALFILGEDDAARDIIRGKAQEGVARELPDPAAKGDGKPPVPELPQVMNQAVDASVQAGGTYEEHVAAAADAAMRQGAKPEDAQRNAERHLQRRAFQAGLNAGPGSWEYGWLRRFVNGLDENGARLANPPQGVMTEESFVAWAFANANIPASQGHALWKKYKDNGRVPAATQIGTDDSSRVE
jgi:hypothetical protein